MNDFIVFTLDQKIENPSYFKSNQHLDQLLSTSDEKKFIFGWMIFYQLDLALDSLEYEWRDVQNETESS